MTWCVCEDKMSGVLFIVSRRAREAFLKFWMSQFNAVPSRVVKTYSEYEDAEDFIKSIEGTEYLLKKIFEENKK